ncbi:hypothetical protein [Plantibacter sp. YIM 135347]|uniref:hypothetical protein n=1 Tax=Plantibacter sp. YIM 135347 TaxID=3423919 RepID=UPI003D34213A
MQFILTQQDSNMVCKLIIKYLNFCHIYVVNSRGAVLKSNGIMSQWGGAAKHRAKLAVRIAAIVGFVGVGVLAGAPAVAVAEAGEVVDVGTPDATAVNAEWTWSTATHPAGSAAVAGGASGGGVYLWGGIYYQPTVGHMAQPLGRDQYETAPSGSGMIGKVSHTTYNSGTQNDAALLATGTQPIAPVMRVSDYWDDASIVDIAHPSDVAPGLTLCHSGWAYTTQAVGGFRCGQVDVACSVTSRTCSIHNADGMVWGGDSGGPVWTYADGGVKLYGWVTGGRTDGGAYAPDGTFPFGSFVPVWAVQNHDWPSSQVLTAWGFPAGNDGTGCFVTTQGCLRS